MQVIDERLHFVKPGRELSIKRLIREDTEGVSVMVDAAMLKLDLIDKKGKKDEPDKIAPKRWAGTDRSFQRLIRTRRALTEDAVAYVGTRFFVAYFGVPWRSLHVSHAV